MIRATLVAQTPAGRSRIDDWTDVPGPRSRPSSATSSASRSSVGGPIVVEGRPVGCPGRPSLEPGLLRSLLLDTALRLGSFTELVGTAVANDEALARRPALADEQAALRRVATLVAPRARPGEVFELVARGGRTAAGRRRTHMAATRATGWRPCSLAGAGAASPSLRSAAASSWTATQRRVVGRSGRPERIDGYSDMAGELAERLRDDGFRSVGRRPDHLGGGVGSR